MLMHLEIAEEKRKFHRPDGGVVGKDCNHRDLADVNLRPA